MTTERTNAMRGLGLTIGCVLLAGAGAVLAESNQERASALSAEGKDLMYEEKYAEAADRFSQAINLDPQGKYYFNLCMAEYSLGRFGAAVTSCEAVDANTQDAALKDKAAKLLATVREEAARQGIDLTPPDGGDGGDGGDGSGGDGGDGSGADGSGSGGTGGTGTPPPQGRPPASLFAPVAPQHEYTWSVGGELIGGPLTKNHGNSSDTYSTGGIRASFNYIAMPSAKIGFGGSLALASVTNSDSNTSEFFADLGAHAFKHICKGHLCVTPLIGLNIGLFNADEDTEMQQTSFGLRANAEIAYAFGKRLEHVVGLNLGGSVFAVGESSGTSGLGDDNDFTGRWLNAGIGYTYRFNTPLGSSPFYSLE